MHYAVPRFSVVWQACARPACFGVLLAFCILGRRSVLADVIYDTFGSEPYVQSSHVFDMEWHYWGGYGNASGWSVASGFTLTNQDYRFDSITMDIGVWEEASPNLGLTIRNDNQGRPGNVVFDLVAPNPTGITTPECQLHTFASSLHPILLANQRYWLVVEPVNSNIQDPSGNVVYVFSASSVVAPGAGRSFDASSGQWEPWPAGRNAVTFVFRLEGAPVPEPGSAALVVIGGLGLWLVVRQGVRRKGWKGSP